MKIKKEEITRENTLLSHAVLETINDSIIKKNDLANKEEINISLMIEGEEVDIRKFFTRLEKDWNDTIDREAKKLMEDKIMEIVKNELDSITDSLHLVRNHMTNLMNDLKIQDNE